MTKQYLFPFEFVEKGSKIVIFGAGKVGQNYIQQLNLSNYCKLLFVVDDEYHELSVPLYVPNKIKEFIGIFDFIVVADNSVENILAKKRYLLANGVAANKIICSDDRSLQYAYSPVQTIATKNYEERFAYEKQQLAIAFRICGGLGDCVITKVIVQELVKIVPDCLIDIYCEMDRVVPVAKSIYAGDQNINRILADCNYAQHVEHYPLAIRAAYIMEIEGFSYGNVYKYSPILAKKIIALIEQYDHYCANIDQMRYRRFIHFKRAEYWKINCYTTYNHSDIFNIKDRRVHIPLQEEYEEKFKELRWGKYITFNYSVSQWGKISFGTKMWCGEYYEEFIRLFKEKYPDIAVVQIGSKNTQHIDGVDHYLLGESLELAKYVLKNAIFHLDGECGLVHLATQLGTMCIVLFGPTPMEYFSYPENINIVSEACGGCMDISEDAVQNCIKGLSEPECMMSILPEKVAHISEEYIESLNRLDSI